MKEKKVFLLGEMVSHRWWKKYAKKFKKIFKIHCILLSSLSSIIRYLVVRKGKKRQLKD
jgi:mRNA-degrading endonuclease YafQ of YafQ-DinJ toxin-antitoxin module